jgi:hypothetical protein
MKKIENMMEQNEEILNSEEPSEGHLERFGQKLKVQNRRRMIIRTAFSIAKIAAIIIVVVFSAFLIKYNQTSVKETNALSITRSQEMNEAEQFYSRLLELSYAKIKNMNFPDEAQKTKVLKEVCQKDESYTKMKEDLQNDPSNEMAQQAMIYYYETRLEVVNQIVANLKDVLNNNS